MSNLKSSSIYIEEFFHDNRGEKPVMYKNIKWLVVLKSEIREARNKLKRNKAAII